VNSRKEKPNKRLLPMCLEEEQQEEQLPVGKRNSGGEGWKIM
jgi:hypothetical protein